MRYALAGLLVLAAVAWWAARDRPAARSTPLAPAEVERAVTFYDFFATEPDPRLLFVGRVVGVPQGFRALVVIEIEGARSESRPSDDGTYSIRAGRRPERGVTLVRVEASAGDLGAVAHVQLEPRGPDQIRVPTLVLRPRHTLRIAVTGRGQPLPGARVSIRAAGVVSTDASGRVEVRLAAGEHEIGAACDGHGRASAKAKVPDVAEVTLDLPRERVVAVTVVDKATGHAVAGATFENVHEEGPPSTFRAFAPPLVVPPTDERGVTLLRGLSEDSALRMAVRAPGYAPPELYHGLGKITIPALVTELRIELDPPRTVRWRVVPGDLPVPPHGTKIAIRPLSSSYLRETPPEGLMEGQDLVVAGWGGGPSHGIAEEPGGGLARLQALPAESAPETSFRKPRRVDVLAREPSGAPVAGAAFLLRDQGGNAMAPVGSTDAEGRVAFRGFYGGLAEVFHLPNAADEHWGAVRAGTVDLERGDGFVEFVLQPAIDLVVRVRLDGKPGLPDSYWLYVDRAPVVADDDYEHGILRARIRRARDDGPIQVALSGPGYPAVRTETRIPEVEIDLLRGGRLVVDVLRPPKGESSMVLERWSDEGQTWIDHAGIAHMAMDHQQQTGILLPPGRYRAKDRRSGLATDPVTVESGAEARIVLDLTRVGFVRGRVEMPAGTDSAIVRIRIDGIDLREFGGNLQTVARDGTFRVTVLPDTSITLEASHPLLRAANKAAVTGPREGVVLRLEPGPTATLELDSAPVDIRNTRPEVAVVLYRGEPEGEPVARLRAAVDGRVLRFGGFEAGTYGVWIDARPFAPVTLRGVALGEGENDLGRAATEDGSTIRVRILVPEGQSAPRIALVAWRTGEPVYSRGLNSAGESDVVLSGLGPGTFRVSAMAVMGNVKRLEQDVTLDGVETRELTLDLR